MSVIAQLQNAVTLGHSVTRVTQTWKHDTNHNDDTDWGRNPLGFLHGYVPVPTQPLPAIYLWKMDLWVDRYRFQRVWVWVGPRTPMGIPVLLPITGWAD
jgi:hypothetical protein